MFDLNRRAILSVLLLLACAALQPALARDSDSGGGNSGSGSGSDNSGSDNSGSGSDDDRDDDDRDDDDRDDDNDNEGSGVSSLLPNGSRDQERALNAVRRGEMVSLRRLKSHLSINYPGKILNVDLNKKSGTFYFQIRILSSDSRIKTVTLNALTLKPRGM